MEAARAIFDEIKRKGLPLINQWIAEKYREDLHLDFKRKRRTSTAMADDDDRRNFSRALSGFANSDGGLIIWGIGAPGPGRGKRTKHPLRKVHAFTEYLDSYISRFVSPNVSGVENHIVFEDGSNDVGYVASYIPRSDSAPHRAEAEGLKYYYKRYGDSFKICEHYELEYMFGRRLQPDLRVFWGVDVEEAIPDKHGDFNLICHVKIGLTNFGKAVANFACLRLRFNGKAPYVHAESVESELIHYSKPRPASKTDFVIVTARALPGLVVYPEDHTHFFTFELGCRQADIYANRLPNFQLIYDLFAENVKGVTGADFTIAGRKIAEAIRKKVGDLAS